MEQRFCYETCRRETLHEVWIMLDSSFQIVAEQASCKEHRRNESGQSVPLVLGGLRTGASCSRSTLAGRLGPTTRQAQRLR